MEKIPEYLSEPAQSLKSLSKSLHKFVLNTSYLAQKYAYQHSHFFSKSKEGFVLMDDSSIYTVLQFPKNGYHVVNVSITTQSEYVNTTSTTEFLLPLISADEWDIVVTTKTFEDTKDSVIPKTLDSVHQCYQDYIEPLYELFESQFKQSNRLS